MTNDATPRGALATPRGAPEIPGVLLAGGLARRMGGGDKPMRTIAGKTILERVIARLKPQCSTLILNANGDPGRFASFGLPVIADTVADFPVAAGQRVAFALTWAGTYSPEPEDLDVEQSLRDTDAWWRAWSRC